LTADITDNQTSAKLKISYDDIIVAMLVINGLAMAVEYSLGIPTPIRPIIFIASVVIAGRALYFCDLVTQIKTLIGLSFLANEMFLLALPVLLIPRFLFSSNAFKHVSKLSFFNVVFFLYAILMLVLTNIFDFSFFTFVFWFLIFGILFVLFVFYSGWRYGSDEALEIFDFFFKVIAIQILIMVLQAFIHRDFKPGDSWTGSSGNSIVIGFYFCILLLFLFIQYIIQLDRPISFFSIFRSKNLLWLIFLAPLMYFNDSKVIIICFVAAGILYFFLFLLLRFLSTFRPVLLVRLIFATVTVLCLYAATYVLANIYVSINMENKGGLKALSYYTNEQSSGMGEVGKFVLYKRVYGDMMRKDPVAWLFGVGPGKFGSRTSNLLAYDVLYKVDNQEKLPSFIKPYSHKFTKEYMRDLWTKEIVERNKYRSATLSMPFAGLITIKAEYGLVGFFFYLGLIYSFSYFLMKKAFILDDWKLKNWAIALSITWFSFPFHMLFDNFQEKNYFMIPLLLLTAVLCSTTSNRQDLAG
jgi:hypothetical protein